MFMLPCPSLLSVGCEHAQPLVCLFVVVVFLMMLQGRHRTEVCSRGAQRKHSTTEKEEGRCCYCEWSKRLSDRPLTDIMSPPCTPPYPRIPLRIPLPTSLSSAVSAWSDWITETVFIACWTFRVRWSMPDWFSSYCLWVLYLLLAIIVVVVSS